MTTNASIQNANATLVAPEDEQQLAVIVEKEHLSGETGLSLQQSYAPLFAQARGVIEKSRGIVVTDGKQKLEITMARACRLELKAIRVAADKTRRDLKDESLRKGRAIDGFFNILSELVANEETRLENHEKFVERQEAARKEALRVERTKVLTDMQADPTIYQCGEMTEETFQQLVEGIRLARAAAAERARKEEAERIERETKERAEQERIRAENERLKAEAAEREKKAAIERELAEKELRRLAEEKAETERAAKAERERIAKENADREAALAAERARVAKEKADAEEKTRRELAEQKRFADEQRAKDKAAADAVAKKEREAREKAEAALQAQRDAEEQKRRAAEETVRRAANAPNKDKLIAYAHAIAAIDFPQFSTPESQAIGEVVKAQRDKLVAWIAQKSEAL